MKWKYKFQALWWHQDLQDKSTGTNDLLIHARVNIFPYKNKMSQLLRKMLVPSLPLNIFSLVWNCLDFIYLSKKICNMINMTIALLLYECHDNLIRYWLVQKDTSYSCIGLRWIQFPTGMEKFIGTNRFGGKSGFNIHSFILDKEDSPSTEMLRFLSLISFPRPLSIWLRLRDIRLLSNFLEYIKSRNSSSFLLRFTLKLLDFVSDFVL